jgi:membrane protease YdiL (CAAX protease family)
MPLPQTPEPLISFLLSISIVCFGFILYHIITINPSPWLSKKNPCNNVRQIIFQRLTGVFVFGFISIVIIIFFFHSRLTLFGTSVPGIKTYFWLLPLSLIIIPLNYYNSKNPENLSKYPQIRLTEWSVELIILSALSWIAYLFAYEFMFRGFFLFSSVALLGIWPAIIINTAIYSLVHIPKGRKETLGAIPFGIIISYLTIKTGTFWFAFFAHVILALSNEWFSIAFHPEIHVKKSKA